MPQAVWSDALVDINLPYCCFTNVTQLILDMRYTRARIAEVVEAIPSRLRQLRVDHLPACYLISTDRKGQYPLLSRLDDILAQDRYSNLELVVFSISGADLDRPYMLDRVWDCLLTPDAIREIFRRLLPKLCSRGTEIVCSSEAGYASALRVRSTLELIIHWAIGT